LRENIGHADASGLRGAEGLLEERITAIKVTGKDLRDPLQELHRGRHDARRRGSPGKSSELISARSCSTAYLFSPWADQLGGTG
jgi:hypothetical protein